MIEVEGDLHRPHTVLELKRLPPKHGCQGGQSLLAVQEQLVATKDAHPLVDREVTSGRVLSGLPDQDGSGRVSSVQRIQEIPDPGRRPNVTALQFGQPEFATIDHVDQFSTEMSIFGIARGPHRATRSESVSLPDRGCQRVIACRFAVTFLSTVAPHCGCTLAGSRGHPGPAIRAKLAMLVIRAPPQR